MLSADKVLLQISGFSSLLYLLVNPYRKNASSCFLFHLLFFSACFQCCHMNLNLTTSP